jgi:hypothetical protein
VVLSEEVLNEKQILSHSQKGTFARKGAIAAMMLKARRLYDLLSQNPSPAEDEEINIILRDTHPVKVQDKPSRHAQSYH